jgi:hypothetical protein
VNKNRFKVLLPVILLFVVLNSFFFSAKNMLDRWNADQNVLIVGNIILFLITILSFFIQQKALRSPNPYVLVRSVFASFMIKFFVCAIAAFIYISRYKKDLNKIALFTCMGLFLVYLFLEVSVLLKMLKQNKHA